LLDTNIFFAYIESKGGFYMSALFHIVSGVMRIAIILGIAGILAKATIFMGHLALNSSQNGLVSLSGLNHQLLIGKKARNHNVTLR
jgi:hypothetical protein